MKGQVESTGLAQGTEVFIRINKTGRLFSSADKTCSPETTGDEFNPLIERDYYGRPTPYQNPQRGRVQGCLVDASGDCQVR